MIVEIETLLLDIAQQMGFNLLFADLQEGNFEIQNKQNSEKVVFQLLPITASRLTFSKLQANLIIRELDVTVRFMLFHDHISDTLFKSNDFIRKNAELRKAEANFLRLLNTTENVKFQPYNNGGVLAASSETFFYYTDSNLWGSELKFKVSLLQEFDCLCYKQICNEQP